MYKKEKTTHLQKYKHTIQIPVINCTFINDAMPMVQYLNLEHQD